MKGTVLGYDKEAGSGVLRGEDGNRYDFIRAEWKSDKTPRNGVEVDFESRDGQAVAIYPLNAGVDFSGVTESMSETVSHLAENENVRKVGALARGAVSGFSFSRSPAGIGASVVYVAALFMSAVTVNMGLLGLEFTLIGTNWGKVALVVALFAAFMRGMGRGGMARLAALAALLLPVLSIVSGVREFAEGMPSRAASDLVGQVIQGLDAGFFLAMLSALVMLFAPMRKQAD